MEEKVVSMAAARDRRGSLERKRWGEEKRGVRMERTGRRKQQARESRGPGQQREDRMGVGVAT